MLKFLLLFFISITFLIDVLYSQPSDQYSSDTTKIITYRNPFEVLVTAQRMTLSLSKNPAAISVVDNDFLQTIPRSIGADEALKLVPGVRIDNQADGSRVHLSIRGQGILSEYGLRGIKVLLDGLPLNDPSGFVPDLYDVDWQSVERIEVLRGPAAAIFGGGSSAGVVNITTYDGSNRPINGEAYSSFGSYGFWKTSAQAGGTNNNLNYHFSLSRTGGDGYRIHTAYHATNIYSKINYDISDAVKLKQILYYTVYFNENAEGLTLEQVLLNPRLPNDDAIPKNEFQQTKRFGAGVVGNINITDNQNLEANFYYRTTTYQEPGSKYIWYKQFYSPGTSLQYNLNSSGEKLNNKLSVGTDLQWQSIDANTVDNLGSAMGGSILQSNEKINQSGFGLFILDRFDIGSDWGLMMSLRYDKMNNKLIDLLPDTVNLSGSANFEKVTAMFGVSFSPFKDLSLYANWGQGFTPPSTDELDSNPANPGGFNQSLQPATSNEIETGIRGMLVKEFFYDVSAFYMTTEKDFDRYRILPARPLETFYRNAGSSRRFGVEIYFIYQPLPSISLQAAYTFSNFKYTAPDSIKNNWLPNSPEHQLDVDFEYELLKHFTIGAGIDLQSKWFIYTDNENVYQDGFMLINLRAAYQFYFSGIGGELSVYVKNLFDKPYMAFTEPDPDGNSYQPGPTREIFGGIKINF